MLKAIDKKIYYSVMSIGLIFLLVHIFVVTSYEDDSSLYVGTALKISKDKGSSSMAKIVSSDTNFYVAWQERKHGHNEIRFKHGIDDAERFGKMKIIGNSSGSSESPQIAAYNNSVYVVWEDNSTGNNEIYFKGSNNKGSSFRTTRLLSNSSGSSESPQIAAYNNSVYVVWEDNSTGNNEIYFKGSNNKGSSFRARLLSNSSGSSESPQIVADSNKFYVTWSESNQNESYIILKSGRGNNIYNAEKIRSIGIATSPKIGLLNGSIYLIWESLELNRNMISFFPYSFYGSGGEGLILSNYNHSSVKPEVAATRNAVYVIWNDVNENNGDILIKKVSNE